MIIALNLLYLIPGVVGGTETYAKSLIHALAKEDSENDYVIFVNAGASGLDIIPAPNFRRVVCPVGGHRRSSRYAWEQAVLPIQLARLKPSVVHSLGYVGPLAARAPQVVTVHDLNFLGHQGRHSAFARRAFGFFVEQTVKRAEHVIAVSEFSRGEIIRHLGIPGEKITVVHHAARETPVAPSGDGVQLSDVVLSVPRPYILAFSALSAHKNVNRLLEAFGRISGSVPHSLVLVGHLPDKAATVRAEIERTSSDRVHFTGYVDSADLSALMRGASLVAYPSLYEGFGLPVLDAQSVGVPVACSSVGSLPEVAGGGAHFFDPLSVDDIAGALKRCLLEPDLRASLVSKGYENSGKFSWTNTARETLAIYTAVAS